MYNNPNEYANYPNPPNENPSINQYQGQQPTQNYPPPPTQHGYQPIPQNPIPPHMAQPFIVQPTISPAHQNIFTNEQVDVNQPTVWPCNPILVTCPYCSHCGFTEVRKTIRDSALCCIIFCLLFIWTVIGFFILLCVCCSDNNKKTTHYCNGCKCKLSCDEC